MKTPGLGQSVGAGIFTAGRGKGLKNRKKGPPEREKQSLQKPRERA